MDAIPHLCDVVRTLPEACPPEARPVLLIPDGHKTHTNNLTFIEMARVNFVTIICLPPHFSHRMQPHDVSVMKPLMTYYTQAVEYWLRSHPGRVVSAFQVAELFGIGYIRAATMRTAVNGFQKIGIWSIDRNVFDEHDFAAAQPTDLVRQPNQMRHHPTETPMRHHATETPMRHHPTETPMRHHPTETPMRHHPTETPMRHHPTETPMRHHPTETPIRHHATETPMRHHPTETPMRHHPTETPMRHHPTETPMRHHPTETPMRHHPTETPIRHHATETPMRHHPTETPMRHHPTETPMRHHPTETPMRHHPTETPMRHHPTDTPMRHHPTETPMHHHVTDTVNSASPDTPPTHRQAPHIIYVKPTRLQCGKQQSGEKPASLRAAHTRPHSRPKGNW